MEQANDETLDLFFFNKYCSLINYNCISSNNHEFRTCHYLLRKSDINWLNEILSADVTPFRRRLKWPLSPPTFCCLPWCFRDASILFGTRCRELTLDFISALLASEDSPTDDLLFDPVLMRLSKSFLLAPSDRFLMRGLNLAGSKGSAPIVTLVL